MRVQGLWVERMAAFVGQVFERWRRDGVHEWGWKAHPEILLRNLE